MSGQRFPKLDEIRALLDGEPYPGIEGDCWIPCTTDDGERDWVQIGPNDGSHEPGKSHNEHYGYPEWGDDEANQPFKQWVFCTKGVRVIKMPKKHVRTHTHTRTHAHPHPHTHKHTHTYMHTYMHTCLCSPGLRRGPASSRPSSDRSIPTCSPGFAQSSLPAHL